MASRQCDRLSWQSSFSAVTVKYPEITGSEAAAAARTAPDRVPVREGNNIADVLQSGGRIDRTSNHAKEDVMGHFPEFVDMNSQPNGRQAG